MRLSFKRFLIPLKNNNMKSKLTCQTCGADAGKATQKKNGIFTTFHFNKKQTCECSPFLTVATTETTPIIFIHETKGGGRTLTADNITIDINHK